MPRPIRAIFDVAALRDNLAVVRNILDGQFGVARLWNHAPLDTERLLGGLEVEGAFGHGRGVHLEGGEHRLGRLAVEGRALVVEGPGDHDGQAAPGPYRRDRGPRLVHQWHPGDVGHHV